MRWSAGCWQCELGLKYWLGKLETEPFKMAVLSIINDMIHAAVIRHRSRQRFGFQIPISFYSKFWTFLSAWVLRICDSKLFFFHSNISPINVTFFSLPLNYAVPAAVLIKEKNECEANRRANWKRPLKAWRKGNLSECMALSSFFKMES